MGLIPMKNNNKMYFLDENISKIHKCKSKSKLRLTFFVTHFACILPFAENV